MPVVDFCNLYKNQYKLIEALFNFFFKLLQYYWQLVFRMQFAVCNSRLNSQLHSRMQFAIQNILQCVYIPKGLKQSGWGSGDKLPPM